MQLTIPKSNIYSLLTSSAITFAVLWIDSLFFYPKLNAITYLNNKTIEEALTISVALPTLILAMTPGLLATAFSITITSREEKQRCLSKIRSLINLETDIPDSFHPGNWLNSPEGVWALLKLSELALLKAGVSITGTVVGVSLYLLTINLADWWLLPLSSLVACTILLYQNLVVFLLERELSR